MSIAVGADYTEILYLLIDLFFPCGKSSRGPSSEMEFYLANFRCEVICEDDFTLGKYISTNKLSKPRLYLLSKFKTDPTDPKTHDVKGDQNLHKSASTPKQNGQSSHLGDVNDKDEDEVMTDQQESHGQHHVHMQEYPDESDPEAVLRGFGLLDYNDYSFLFDETVVDPVADCDGNQYTRY